GVAAGKLVSELKRHVPATAQVRTAKEQASDDKQGVASFITFIRAFLLGFGGIALFVGSFVIFNTLSITVAQRTRELATLRTLGASRRQVRRLVVLESIAIGALASVVGLFAGFALARGLSALFSALGLAGGFLLLLVGVASVASQVVGMLAGVVGLPARRLGGAAGRLASENAVRNPARTAATAAALMIGLALVSFVAVLGKGVHGSLDRGINQQVTADYVATSQNGWSSFPAGAGNALAKAPGVEQASSIRS